ncbi:MAG: Flp family type IVb pilin [Gaiellaceae bacterium]
MTVSEGFGLMGLSWRKEQGQTMAEYGIVLGVVCVLTVAAFTALHAGIADAVNTVTGLIP